MASSRYTFNRLSRAALTKATMSNLGETYKSKIVLFRKAKAFARDHGISTAARRTIWRLHFARFQKLRKRLALLRGDAAPFTQFLGSKFELHPSNAGLSEELIMFGAHEPVATGVYSRHLSVGDHVLDVGSNIGFWLLLASQQVGDRGRVLGFEPVPSNYDILQRNIKRSGRKNIEIRPWALGSESGNALFYQSEVPNWGSLMSDSRLLPTGSFSVSVKTLDLILREFPTFRPTAMRMDVEGAELMVLKGAQGLLKRFRPTLFIEFHPFILGWTAIRTALTELGNGGYERGVLIERTWDQPWISKWVRERRCWSGSINALIRKIESPNDGLVGSTFTLILR